MAQNHPKNQNNNPLKPTILSHSRSISTIRIHQKIISFMPKLLLKTFHRDKRSITNKHLKDPRTKNDEKVGNIKRLAKHFQKNDQLMQRLMPVSMMSFVFRNKKEHDQEQRKDQKSRNLAKQVSKKTRSNEGPCSFASTSKNYCKFGVGDVTRLTANGGKIRRVRSVVKTEEIAEAKGGLRIIKTRSRERDQEVEKGFELCKKKILMGEKCRPLHGSLHYDENGILVPDILPDT